MGEQRDEVVISGIAGFFPECNNADELKELLFNKINGVTIDSRRWKPNELGAVSGTGKLKNMNQFDAVFSRVHPNVVEVMDPMTRLFIERSVEAVIDAGLSPADLHGTNTAVFSGASVSESEMYNMDSSTRSSFSMLGRSRAMQPNRVSYILNLNGPSYSTDGGWICGSNILEVAKKMIDEGSISAAIVGVSNLVTKPETQFQFQGLNRLNDTVHTKSFDSHADGYNRSEACVVMMLQRASDAKRSYGTLLNVQSMQFGDHQRHIMEREGSRLKSLLINSYKEANIDPATVEFIEANGSGIKCEDTMELNIMEEVFCTGQRKTPLKVGSVKSNVGHCEVAGLFVSIVKAIIAFESGYLPPNINYTEPNENVSALKTGKIQVITEKTPFDGDLIGVSSFGTLNAFSHVILKRNHKIKNKLNKYVIPRLIVASGRNEENVRQTIEKIKSYGNDDEYVTLTNNVFTRNINAHFHRSFSIWPNLDESRFDNIMDVTLEKRPVWFIFSGMGSQWQGMGSSLMKIPIFSDAINKCDSILRTRGVDIKNILTSQDPQIFENILNSFVGIAAVQIGLVDILRALEIIPDGILGHSVGELGCAYADGCITLEEMILSAYARGRASIETELIPGMMAAIGLGYQEIKEMLPHDIDVACHNSATSCTISGPVDSINTFVSELKAKGIFAKAVNVAGIAYHSRYIQSAGPTLLKYLKEIIKNPKIRSSKWISSSLPEAEWNSDLAKYSSPEYQTNNLLSNVLFEEALKHIPSDAITIEIAPHGLLQSIIKGALPAGTTNISLTKKMYGDDSNRILLGAIGKMYLSGLNPQISSLYPRVSFPVGRGTPIIHNLPFWDHNHSWTNISAIYSDTCYVPGEMTSSILLNDNIHLLEYRIQDHHVVPFSYVLTTVWKKFIEMNEKAFAEEPVQFKDLRFKNNFIIHPSSTPEAYLMIQRGSGLFEYSLDDEVLLSGQIELMDDTELGINADESTGKRADVFYGSMSKEEVYAVFENNGFSLGKNFKNITNIDVYKNRIEGRVQWKSDWLYFLDGLLKFPLLENVDVRYKEAVSSVRQITITPKTFEENTHRDNIRISYNAITKYITCSGVEISGVKTCPILLPEQFAKMKIEDESFVQFNRSKRETIKDFIRGSFDIITEADRLYFNSYTGKLILCPSYHYNDPISKECTKLMKEIVENQLSISSLTINWENVKNESEYDESGRFITVTDVNYLQDTMKALTNKKLGYIIVCSKQKLRDSKDWKVITQSELNDHNYLTLIKKKIIIDGNCTFINLASDSQDLSVWKTLCTYKSSKDMQIYIVSNEEPSEGVSTYVNEILRKYKSLKLRFLFVFDSNAPAFGLNKSFYMDQLSGGLIVNIYKNGGWGSYKRIVLQDVFTDCNNSVIENLEQQNISTNVDGHRKLTIKHLGLNFKDLVIDNDTENEFGPFDYSGLTDNDKRIMGITVFDKMSAKIKTEPLLSWPVPPTWSLEDATTVPLSYAMSYYVLELLCQFDKPDFVEKKSLLVTSGLHPIGQAAIAIGLSKNLEVYVIVETSQQADRLFDIFPELSRSRVLVNTKNQFDIQLKMMTMGRGIDIILNFLSGEAFQAAFRIMVRGMFFDFAKSDMKNKRSMGLRQFLWHASYTAVGSNNLLNESDHNKKIIQKAIFDGLNTGLVKPFRCNGSAIPIYSNNAVFGAIRAASKLVTPEKIVLSLDNYFKCSESQDNVKHRSHGTYQCNPNYVYIINDHKSDWLVLADWLVDRGARNIVIAVNTSLMSLTNSRRFDRLVSRNISVQIESDSHLQTKKESLDWFNRLTSSKVLGSIFIMNQFDDKKINNLRYSFEEYKNKTALTSFVCISSKGKHICNELKSVGVNAFNVSLDGQTLGPKSLAKILSSLDMLFQRSNTVGSSSFVCTEKNDNMLQQKQLMNDVLTNFFPGSVDELYLLNDKMTREACFVQVQTRSPAFSQLKSVTPVFIIPGFKPRLTETLYKQLIYPAFEARLPESVNSIDELSEILVNKLKNITNRGYVSLVGESWGGIVALKMAQILESQGTLVTVSLLEGDPEILSDWSESFLSNDNFVNKLTSLYDLVYKEYSKHALEDPEEESQPIIMSSGRKIFDDNVQRAISAIRSKLRVFMESKPLPNKLHTKVFIFRYDRTSKLGVINLNDYCVDLPSVHTIAATDYKRMVANKKMLDIICKNVIHSYPTGVELSLSDKYKQFFFYVEKIAT